MKNVFILRKKSWKSFRCERFLIRLKSFNTKYINYLNLILKKWACWHISISVRVLETSQNETNFLINASKNSFRSEPGLAEWSGLHLGRPVTGSIPRRAGKFLTAQRLRERNVYSPTVSKKMILNDKSLKNTRGPDPKSEAMGGFSSPSIDSWSFYKKINQRIVKRIFSYLVFWLVNLT